MAVFAPFNTFSKAYNLHGLVYISDDQPNFFQVTDKL